MATASLREPLDDARDQSDVRAYSLRALVEDHDVSVRLRNSIVSAAATGTLPFPTVGAYIDAGALAEAMMLRDVRNFGRKTARELAALVWAVADRTTGDAAVEPAPEQCDERDQFLALLADDTIGTLASEEILSARLAGMLAQPAFAEKTLAEVLDNYLLTAAEMLRTPNCGRKSVNEFRDFCRRNAVRRFRAAGYDDGDAIFDMLLNGRPVFDVPPPSHAVAQEADNLAAPKHETLAERLDWLMSDLPERAQTILRRRNGIGQTERETLEEIGCDFGVTRERIRQVEAKSVKRLATKVRRAPLRSFILAEARLHWDGVAEGAPRLRQAELLEAKRRIDPHLRLACEVEALSIEAWLDLVAQPFPFGWLAPWRDRNDVDAADEQLGDLSALPVPYPLAGLAVAAGIGAATLAVELIRNNNLRHGYLMPRRVGARSTRLVRLHAIAASSQGIYPTERLLDRYRQRFDDDPCHERDAEIVMDAAPHLFIEIEDGSWAAINRPGFVVAPAEAPVTPRARPEEAGTIAHALQSTLERQGPTRLSDLLDDAISILPDGRSVNSIGPVLLTRRELFVRALPGVYALHDQIAPLAARLPEDWPILFNDTQARQYVLSRYAGEPRDIMPLWSAATEYAFCRWARHSGGPGIFASLLSIAVVDDWPVDEPTRDEWRHIKAQHGRYELGVGLRHGAAYERPDLDRVYAACRYIIERRTFNYCAANRVIGRKLDSHVGAGLVAMLLRLGVIEEVACDGFRWQRAHQATQHIGPLAKRFEQAFTRADSAPDWLSPLGRELSAEICAPWDHRTWVDAAALSGMFDASLSASFDEPDDDPLARLMAEQRRVREAERREATLDWLLTQ